MSRKCTIFPSDSFLSKTFRAPAFSNIQICSWFFFVYKRTFTSHQAYKTECQLPDVVSSGRVEGLPAFSAWSFCSPIPGVCVLESAVLRAPRPHIVFRISSSTCIHCCFFVLFLQWCGAWMLFHCESSMNIPSPLSMDQRELITLLSATFASHLFPWLHLVNKC